MPEQQQEQINLHSTDKSFQLAENVSIKKGALRDGLANYPDPKIRENMIKNIPKVDYLIVFGQGVLEKESLERPKGDAKVEVVAQSWMRMATAAAAELYLAGVVKKIVVSGGKTGGEMNKSEAELMADILTREYKIPAIDIVVEAESKNSLDNLAYSLNDINKKINEENQLYKKTAIQYKPKKFADVSIGLLAIKPQFPRAEFLTSFFGVDSYTAFSSEDVLNLIAHLTDNQPLHNLLGKRLSRDDDLSYPESRFAKGDWKKLITMSWDEQSKLRSRSMLSPNAPTHFEQQEGYEKRGIRLRAQFEDFLLLGIKREPKFAIGFWSKLNDSLLDRRLKSVFVIKAELEKLNNSGSDGIPQYILEGQEFYEKLVSTLDQLGIKPDTPIDEARTILEKYTKGPKEGGKRPSLEENYGVKGTEEDRRKRLEELTGG